MYFNFFFSFFCFDSSSRLLIYSIENRLYNDTEKTKLFLNENVANNVKIKKLIIYFLLAFFM